MTDTPQETESEAVDMNVLPVECEHCHWTGDEHSAEEINDVAMLANLTKIDDTTDEKIAAAEKLIELLRQIKIEEDSYAD
jgi:Zn-finger protein